MQNYIVVCMHGTNTLCIVKKSEYSPFTYEPIVSFDDRERAEEELACIKDIGIQEYLQEICRKSAGNKKEKEH